MFYKLREFFGVKDNHTCNVDDYLPSIYNPDSDKFVENECTPQAVTELAHEELVELDKKHQLEETNMFKDTPKKKYKASYYKTVPDNKRHRNELSSLFKVLHHTDENDLVTVKVQYIDSTVGPVPSVRVSGDQDLNITMEFMDQTVVVPCYEVHDLALALMKYHELKCEANFKKVKKEKKNV